jgi:hypothetical protein
LDGAEASDTVSGLIDGQQRKIHLGITTWRRLIGTLLSLSRMETILSHDTTIWFSSKGPSSMFLLAKEGTLPVLFPRITGSGGSSNVILKVKDKGRVWHGL